MLVAQSEVLSDTLNTRTHEPSPLYAFAQPLDLLYRNTLEVVHTRTQEDTMPHSVSPESTPGDGSNVSQPTIKSEAGTQDIAMGDVPSAAEPDDKTKVNLEELFDDDDDSDGEFASSAPVKSEEDFSQPAATL